MDPQLLSTVIIALIIALGTLAGRWTDSNRKIRAQWKRTAADNIGLITHIYECHQEIARRGGTIPPPPKALSVDEDDE